MTIKKLALAVLVAGGVAGAANAAQINGSIGFSGHSSGWKFDGTCSTIANCNGFKLNPSTSNIEVDVSSGDFNVAGSQVGDIGTMANVNVSALPIAPQWSIGGFSFDLTSATINLVINGSGSKFLNMTGSGIVHGAGFDDTAGEWSWTGTATGTSFTFASSTTTEATVPEPVSMSLMGLGLLAGGGLIRRRRAA